MQWLIYVDTELLHYYHSNLFSGAILWFYILTINLVEGGFVFQLGWFICKCWWNGGGGGEWRSRHFRSNWQFLFLAWYAAILSLSFLRYSSSFHPSFNLTVEYPNSHGYVQHLSSVVSWDHLDDVQVSWALMREPVYVLSSSSFFWTVFCKFDIKTLISRF